MEDLEELRKRYDALPALPDTPGERRWYDRLRTWEDFLEFGPRAAEHLSRIEGTIDYDIAVNRVPPDWVEIVREVRNAER